MHPRFTQHSPNQAPKSLLEVAVIVEVGGGGEFSRLCYCDG